MDLKIKKIYTSFVRSAQMYDVFPGLSNVKKVGYSLFNNGF